MISCKFSILCTDDGIKSEKLLLNIIFKPLVFDLPVTLWRIYQYLRILSCTKRFLTNCKKQQVYSPLTSSKIENQRGFLIKKKRHRYSKCEKFELSQQQLNLKLSEKGSYKCYGRIQGEYPFFLPREFILAEKLAEEAHIQTIHGGVTLTMAKVRSKCLVLTLRQLLKRVSRQCYGCKKFHIKSYPVPQKELMPADRFTIQNHRYRLCRAFFVQVKRKEAKKGVSFTVHL